MRLFKRKKKVQVQEQNKKIGLLFKIGYPVINRTAISFRISDPMFYPQLLKDGRILVEEGSWQYHQLKGVK